MPKAGLVWRRVAREMTSKKARGPFVSLGDRVDAARRVGRNELVISAVNTDELVRYTMEFEHRSEGAGVRAVDVTCRQCGVGRTLWFRIAPDEVN